ncbi:MAG: hypothetical protein JXC36_08640 [Candidatus Atribacteria bacterium]|nr:hypothetical protein [Candidatus Atribacteria bacterium]
MSPIKYDTTAMKLILDLESYNVNKYYTDQFKKIYTNGFPDKNEREDFIRIKKRVIGEKELSEPHSIIVLSINEQLSEVNGGLIADWYADSKCIHLTYLVVDVKYKKRGFAKSLISEGVIMIKDWIENTKKIEIRNVFFESNNPEKTIKDNFDPAERLEIFSHLGAKWIDLPYIQPALDSTKKEVDNLLLLSFPQFNAKGDKIPEVEIAAFLKDLYQSLGAFNDNASLIEMQKYLKSRKNADGDIVLKPIPECVHYKFYKASVTWHFIQKNSFKINPSFINDFSSFEKDLLNFQNQKKPPFNSYYIEPLLEAIIILPGTYSYTSEGRVHSKTTKANRIDLAVNLAISYTKIHNSDSIIWHLTFSPVINQFFTELDLIKLSALFSSSQENSTIKDEIQITIPQKNIIKISPLDLIAQLGLCENDIHLENLGAGIVQIEMLNLELFQNFSTEDFFKSFRNKKNSIIKDNSVKHFSKALCGIILGIFDFNRMNDEEIFDTIQPIVESDSLFIILCRGSLLKISHNDEIMESVSNTIVISPYLLLPSMVLAFNENLLIEARMIIDNSLNQGRKIKLHEVNVCQSKVRNIINQKYLADIFYYSTEKEIIKYGNCQRGIDQIYLNIQHKLLDLSELINIKKEERSNFSNAFLNAFLSFIAMVQLNSLFTEWVFFKSHSYIFYLVESLISIALFFLIRAKSVIIFKSKRKRK